MSQLPEDILQQIKDLLESVMRDEQQRRTLVDQAFYGSRLVANITLSGSPRNFVSALITQLQTFGEIKGKQALWVLLETVSENLGENWQRQIAKWKPYIDQLSIKEVDFEKSRQIEEQSKSPPLLQPYFADQWRGSTPSVTPGKILEPNLPPAEKPAQPAPKTAWHVYIDSMQPIPPVGPKWYMAPCLVSNSLFFEFVRANLDWRPGSGRCVQRGDADGRYLQHWTNGKPVPQQGNLPVINISLRAARAFAIWLSDLAGRAIYLPTVEQWQIALQAGRDDWFVQEIGKGHVNYFDTSKKLRPVDAYNPNPYGIHDLLGNAYDMCVPSGGSRSVLMLVGGCYLTLPQLLLEQAPVESETICPPHASFRCVYTVG